MSSTNPNTSRRCILETRFTVVELKFSDWNSMRIWKTTKLCTVAILRACIRLWTRCVSIHWDIIKPFWIQRSSTKAGLDPSSVKFYYLEGCTFHCYHTELKTSHCLDCVISAWKIHNKHHANTAMNSERSSELGGMVNSTKVLNSLTKSLKFTKFTTLNTRQKIFSKTIWWHSWKLNKSRLVLTRLKFVNMPKECMGTSLVRLQKILDSEAGPNCVWTVYGENFGFKKTRIWNATNMWRH